MAGYLLLTLLQMILLYGGECARQIGCYRENSVEAPIMSGEHHNYPGLLTPKLCIDFCSSKLYDYAGIRNMIECMCSVDRPSYQFLADLNDCDVKCNGNMNEKCGGNWKVIVYEINERQINYVQQNYLGCYVDKAERTLSGKYEINIPKLTPEYCVGYCYRHGYRFSGLQYANQCFCGNELNSSKAPEADCNMKCSGDSTFNCGGGFRNSVYQTDKISLFNTTNTV